MVQGVHAHFRPADSLHQGHLEGGTDGHDFAGGLHLGSQTAVGVYEFIKGPAGKLYHQVNGGFEAGHGRAGYVVGDFVQIVPDGNLGSHLGDGIPGCLGSKGGRTGHTGVYFDNGILKAVRIQSKLHVAAAGDLQFFDDGQRRRTEHLVFLVRQSQGGSGNDGVPGMHAHGIQVFHGAYGDDIARSVPDYFKFDFLPAGYALFNEDLVDGGSGNTAFGNGTQGFFVSGNPTAGAAQGKGRTDDHGVTQLVRQCHRTFNGCSNIGRNNGLADLFHGVLEQLSVLGTVDGIGSNAQQTHAVLRQEPFLFQLHGQVQTGLAAQCPQQAVGFFFLDDPLDHIHAQGFQIDLIGHGSVGHDGSRIGVDQNHFDSVFSEYFGSLRSCIVKFGSLTDDDRTGADQQDLTDAGISWHTYPSVWFK